MPWATSRKSPPARLAFGTAASLCSRSAITSNSASSRRFARLFELSTRLRRPWWLFRSRDPTLVGWANGEQPPPAPRRLKINGQRCDRRAATAMEQKLIWGVGMASSRIGLGTWSIGGWMWGGSDEAEAVKTIRTALDLGITLIDTAPAYGFGRSEELVGRAIAEHGERGHVLIATKAGLAWRAGAVYRDASAERIRTEIEDSLRRLGTSYIDIYQVHWPDPLVPVEETAAELRRLYEDGTIRAIGVSKFSPKQIETLRAVAPLHLVQAPDNLLERGIETDVLPSARRRGLTALACGALCRGLLSGRMRSVTKFLGD